MNGAFQSFIGVIQSIYFCKQLQLFMLELRLMITMQSK